ncbi:hypothetical protein M3Y94_00285000 [Aphelenchoides besseyi]|nr:hypothetical protein M3Y94_00285000 [Aphelenchoides besseyi]
MRLVRPPAMIIWPVLICELLTLQEVIGLHGRAVHSRLSRQASFRAPRRLGFGNVGVTSNNRLASSRRFAPPPRKVFLDSQYCYGHLIDIVETF